MSKACCATWGEPASTSARVLCCGPVAIVGVLESTNCGSAVALISVVAFGGSESHDVVVAAPANYDGAR
jgi:hypothetical protein